MKFEQSLINKFEGSRLTEFLVEIIPNYTQQLIETRNIGKIGKEAILHVLNNYIGDMNTADEENIDKIERAFFSFLFYQDQDTHYHKKIINNQTISVLWKKLENSPEFSCYIDKKLYDSKNEYGIVSIRREQDDLLILFNFGTYKTKKLREEKQFLVSCRFNLDINILSIGIKDGMFSKIREEDKVKFGLKRYDLVQNILGIIYKMQLGLRFEKYNGQALERALYDLYKEQSEKAEDLIKTSIEEEDGGNLSVEKLKTEAEDFLKVNFLLKEPEKFIEKALSMKYQDQAAQMPKSIFINNGGYIFGFSFVEKQVSRSDNKSNKKKPIYEYKLYWNLKEIIQEGTNLSQLSMYWKFNKRDFSKGIFESREVDLSFVELDYKIQNNELVLHYYVNSNQPISEEYSFDRRRREDYALRQINRYLS